MRKILLFLTMVAALTAYSVRAQAGTFGRYGLGVFGSSDYGKGETKSFSLGYEEDWFGPFIYQYEGGVFADQGGHGRTGSGFGNISAGVEVQPGYFIARSLWGVGAITSPDSMLGGWFEFNQDLLLGVKDHRGNIIGVDYKHMSSAGIYSPNRGRDFILVHVEIPW